MILRRILFATSLSLAILASSAHAEAPVVDDSENFALFEQQTESSSAVRNNRYAQLDEERPLAHEDYSETQTVGNSTSLMNKIQGLQQEIQELRGQLEVQSNELKKLQQQQVEFYKDLDARLRHEQTSALPKQPETDNLSSASSTPLNLDQPTTSIATTKQDYATQPVVAPVTQTKDEKTAYLAAYDLITTKQYTEALPAMQAFVQQYPNGGYTANAHYWIGELYMVQKNYTEAIQHFETVIQRFPKSNKSSASMLKIGYALAATGEVNAAKQRLQTVIKQYPDTHAAQLALAKLESLGHS